MVLLVLDNFALGYGRGTGNRSGVAIFGRRIRHDWITRNRVQYAHDVAGRRHDQRVVPDGLFCVSCLAGCRHEFGPAEKNMGLVATFLCFRRFVRIGQPALFVFRRRTAVDSFLCLAGRHLGRIGRGSLLENEIDERECFHPHVVFYGGGNGRRSGAGIQNQYGSFDRVYAYSPHRLQRMADYDFAQAG